MRGNRVKKKLEAGEIATAISGHSSSADTIDFIGSLGFDGFWIEGEHGPVTWDQISSASRACDLWGITSLVRVHINEPGHIGRMLDRGANGIAVPHVNTKEDAQRVVRAAKFAPLGMRGIYSTGRRSYGDSNYLDHANEEILVVVLIEDLRAIKNLHEILTVDHVDVFLVAPGDLSQSMGFLGQFHHPEVQSVVEAAIRKIVAAGRVAGTTGAENTMKRYIGAGARFLQWSYDTWIQSGAQRYLSKLAAVAQPLLKSDDYSPES
jgi:4-hydroxy-2-oxoheptanedioate aldolase